MAEAISQHKKKMDLKINELWEDICKKNYEEII